MNIIAHGGSQSGGSPFFPPDITLNTTGANRIFVITANANSVGVISYTDSKSNTYSTLTKYFNGSASGPYVRIDYSQDSPSVGSGHTFHVTANGVNGAFIVLAVDSTLASPFETGTDQGNSSNGSTVQPSASITPTQANSLILCAASSSTLSAPSIDSGFSIVDNMPGISGQCYGLSLFYLVQSSAMAEQPTVTFSGSVLSAIGIAAFKLATPASTETGTASLAFGPIAIIASSFDIRSSKLRQFWTR